MEELKTLKDFDFDDGSFYGDMSDNSDTQIKNALKLEAIKWIKHIQSEPFPIFPAGRKVKLPWFGETITLDTGEGIFATKVVLQAFFEIREEDLK